MAMKLVREGKKTEYKQENGQIITVVQPEVYQRIYCKNCGNEVDSEEQATGTGRARACTRTSRRGRKACCEKTSAKEARQTS